MQLELNNLKSFMLIEADDPKRTRRPNSNINPDPKGRLESFDLKLKRIYESNKHKYQYLFIRFTNNPERGTGINPKYKWDTPLGIYAYPFNLTSIAGIIKQDNNFLYASDYSGIVIFGWNQTNTDKKTIYVTNKNDPRSGGAYMPQESISDEQFLEYVDMCRTYLINNPERMFFLIRTLNGFWSNDNMIQKVQKKYPDFIHSSQFGNRSNGYKDRDAYQEFINRDNEFKTFCANEIIEWLGGEAKNNKKFTEIFNISRVITGENAKRWTEFMRKSLNISCIIDDGTSLIHSNEPFQGVFFEPHKVSLIEVLKNDLFKKPKDDKTFHSNFKYLREYLQGQAFKETIIKQSGYMADCYKYDSISDQDNCLQTMINILIEQEDIEKNNNRVSVLIKLSQDYCVHMKQAMENKDIEKLKLLIEIFKNSVQHILEVYTHIFTFGLVSEKSWGTDIQVSFVRVFNSISTNNSPLQNSILKLFRELENKLYENLKSIKPAVEGF